VDIIRKTEFLLSSGESLVIAVIIARSGSAPREVGARMIIRKDGETIGSVGGGLLEAKVLKAAMNVFKSRKNRIERFVLTANEAELSGMICGGKVEVLLLLLDASKKRLTALFRNACNNLDKGKGCWLAAIIPGRGKSPDETDLTLFQDDGTISATGKSKAGDILTMIQKADAFGPGLITLGKRHYFFERLVPDETVYIFGAGHVSRSLAVLISVVGFRTVVLDDRPEFVNTERFGTADQVIVIDSFRNVFQDLEIHENSYIVIVTRGHACDEIVLRQALATEAGYIGMIGSKRKKNAIFKSLVKDGFSSRDLDRVHCPIGLSISAETPEEIAVSITAEVIKKKRELP